jgi:hypothetical protein
MSQSLYGDMIYISEVEEWSLVRGGWICFDTVNENPSQAPTSIFCLVDIKTTIISSALDRGRDQN